MAIIKTAFHRGKFLWRLKAAWALFIGRPVGYELPNKVNVQGWREIRGIEL